MSLKAKLEAVIYAAEEPVTLVQLAALFSVEAFELKAERAAASAAESAAASAAEIQPSEVLEPAASEPEAAEPAAAELPAEPVPPPVETESVESQETEPVPPAVEGEAPTPASDPEADQKREARARDREVRAILQELIDELIASYSADVGGIEIREIAGGYRMATKPEYHDAVRGFIRSLKPPLKLSLQALETLAVVAYKQPVTAPEVSEVRGVESAGTLGSLLSRKLIATAGRKPVIGRPILYKTTREFLLRFGLNDVAELPSMEEFEKMAQIELDEDAPAEEPAATAESLENAEVDEGESGNESAGEEPAPAEPTPAPTEAEASHHEQ